VFRITPNGCTKRNMARSRGLSSPRPWRRGIAAPVVRTADVKNRYVNLEQIANILLIITRKGKIHE